MKKTGNYRLEHFSIEVADPQIEIVEIRDRIKEKTCSIEILLILENVKLSFLIVGFSYAETWCIEDIYEFVSNEFDKNTI